ncbi:hypothetical protein A6D6_01024 [Alcanivorax xiamenensis]|uniref:Uncharacterized protein n=1 Tax=Alcanivorax xiamenensis TaxID=1177156 RepID=A0ABQ6YAR5_9GAMM|nr:hypothetical protein A6D6_01024 [Alcanivorax xiamenensis]
MKRFGQPVMAVDHGGGIKGQVVLVPFVNAAGDIVAFVVNGIELVRLRFWPAGASHVWGDQGDVVIVGVLGLQEVFGKVVDIIEDFEGA